MTTGHTHYTDHIQQFLDHGRFIRNWSPKTIRCYGQCLGAFQHAVGELPTRANLQAFVVQMRQQGRSAGGCNVIIRAINSFTTWLHEEGLIPEPLKLKLLRAERTVITTLSDTDIKRLLLHSCKERAWVMVVVMVDTGCVSAKCLGSNANTSIWSGSHCVCSGKAVRSGSCL